METTEDQTVSACAKRRRFTRQERADHVCAWKSGGGSAAAYASEHGMSSASLYAWARKAEPGPPARRTASAFVPVRIGGAAPSRAMLRVTLRCGGTELVAEGGDPGSLASLAAALKREVFDV